METTAEGIESLDQLDLVRKLNVSHVQGFVYSQPVPQAELVEHAEAGSWLIKPAGPAKQRTDRVSLFRKVAAIHDNHRYGVAMRNLSATGAFIEGLIERSEEHPSELQSLMRISYAVFCLKKTKKTT